jgi:hypothetical protein
MLLDAPMRHKVCLPTVSSLLNIKIQQSYSGSHSFITLEPVGKAEGQ